MKQESRVQKAIQLLKQQPFEFIDHGKYRGALPENFTPKLGDKDWAEATAVMAVLRSRPGTWRWMSDTLKSIGRLRDRVVRAGMGKLKAEGWVHHTGIYDERRKNLTTFILAFAAPIPEHQREAQTRFSLLHSADGWLFGYSRDGGRYTLHDGVGKKRGDMSVHPPYGHISTKDRTQTLKRVQTFISDPSAAESEITQCDSPPPAPQEPEAAARPTTRKVTPSPPAAPQELSENVITHRKQLTRKLEALGEKRDDSEEAALAYEEFVATQIIAELSLPERSDKPRRKLENLAWIESSLLGMILLKMSSSSCWTVQTARRVLRRADEGYIRFDDIRILLFAFDWTRDRRSRKTLETMTFYKAGHFDECKGEQVTVDAWKQMITNARETYRKGILGPVLEQRNRLFPQNEDDLEVNWDVRNRVLFGMKAICTGAVKPDEERAFRYSSKNPDALAFLLSRHRRSEETQRKVDESKDLLEEYFATDYAGILLYRSNYHLLPETMGVTLDGIKKRHHARVDMIHQRLSYHGIATDDVQPYI